MNQNAVTQVSNSVAATGNVAQDIGHLQRYAQFYRIRNRLFASEADENNTGPGSFVIVDPDGNPILVDQHI